MDNPGMDAEERFELAIAREAYRKLYAEGGLIMLQNHELSEIATGLDVPDALANHVVKKLVDSYQLQTEGGWTYIADIRLAAAYERDYERAAFWQHNELRRTVLRLAADAFENGRRSSSYQEGAEQFVDVPWVEAISAAKVLEHLGLLEVREYMGHNFEVTITTRGYDVIRDETELRAQLPVSAADDVDAHAQLPRDLLIDLVTSVEELLRQRQWDGALREISRGDEQFDARHWTDAVREYYAATESGLKYRLDEEGVQYSDGAALKDLSRLASQHSIIPVNYQALFGFADSIRSPRSHGAGGSPVEVEVGPSEAALMGNHARTLLMYLAQRPRMRVELDA